MIRPLLPDDVPAAGQVQVRAFDDLDRRSGEPARDPAGETAGQRRERVERRIAHLQRIDPDGVWVWQDGSGAVAGVALSLRRGPLWFLSLLVVDPAVQSTGAGRQLMAAAMGTCGATGWVLSSSDPRALRTYARAGFTLHPAFRALGPVDRALLPAVGPVREGSWDDDRELLEAVALSQRGAGLGPDVGHHVAGGARLLVTDGPDGRGWVVPRGDGVSSLAASSPAAAQRLLWAALAEATPGVAVEVDWMTGAQQWALQVCLQARLPLLPGPSSCLRGRPGPLSPYLPSGAFG